MLLSCRICEANTHLVVGKDGVVCSHEDITQYPACQRGTDAVKFRSIAMAKRKALT